jgi:ubiquinone/menaquinone biosynthesis C-methylase UbiE
MSTKDTSKQSSFFLEGEGDAWFKRNKAAIENKTEFFDTETIKRVLDPFKSDINNICEIGCGYGAKLNDLCIHFGAAGYGVDPSAAAVQSGNEKHNNMSLSLSTASNLPYSEAQFDLVIFGFCLCMVDRSEVFKSISEADRILRTGGFLAVADFDPSLRHKRPYHHLPGLYSYKNAYSQFFTAGGHYYLVAKESFSHSSSHFVTESDERLSISILYKEPDAY